MKGLESGGIDAVWKREVGKGTLSTALQKGSWLPRPDSPQPLGSSACPKPGLKGFRPRAERVETVVSGSTSPRPSNAPTKWDLEGWYEHVQVTRAGSRLS